MSTNAIIKMANSGDDKMSVALYKHWDGYPSATLPWLEKFNKEFVAARGVNNPYKFAQLIRSSVSDGPEFNLDPSRDTGWAVVPSNTTAEFVYYLELDGSVKVINHGE